MRQSSFPPIRGCKAACGCGARLVDEGLFDGVTEISFSAMFRERMKTMPEEIRQARFRNVGDPRRTDRFKSTYEHGVQSPFVVHAVAAYERAFKLLEATLAENGGPWILGADPSLADINLMPFAARLDYLGLLDLWTGEPAAGAELVGARQRLAEFQIRAARAYLGARVHRNAQPTARKSATALPRISPTLRSAA